MRPSFAEALGNLLAEYADEPIEELISELELQLMALREREAAEE